MGHFDNIANVTPSQSLPYIEPGQWVLSIDRCVIGTSQRGKGDFFVAEFTVVSSTHPRFQPGSKVSMVQMFNKGEVALANIKSFAAATLGTDHQKITKAVMDKFVTDDGKLVQGKYVACNAQQTKTRAGNDFTKLMWEPYSNQSYSPSAAVQEAPPTAAPTANTTPAAAPASSAYSATPPTGGVGATAPVPQANPAVDELFGI